MEYIVPFYAILMRTNKFETRLWLNSIFWKLYWIEKIFQKFNCCPLVRHRFNLRTRLFLQIQAVDAEVLHHGILGASLDAGNFPPLYGSKFMKYPCHICPKSFSKTEDLKRHIRVHTGERPYCCPHCPYKAAQKGTLTQHMMRHNKKWVSTSYWGWILISYTSIDWKRLKYLGKIHPTMAKNTKRKLGMVP